jgi:hypothetical protein
MALPGWRICSKPDGGFVASIQFLIEGLSVRVPHVSVCVCVSVCVSVSVSVSVSVWFGAIPSPECLKEELKKEQAVTQLN